PRSPGLDTMGCMRASEAGQVRAALCLGGNLYGSNPDSAFAARALGRLEQVTYLSTTLNTGHAWGRGRETLILPLLARDDEPEPPSQESMFNFVRLSDGGPARLAGPRSETAVITDLASRTLGSAPVDWAGLGKLCHLRQMIARVVPGFEKLGEIDRTKQEFQIGGRTFHTPRFATPTGRAAFKALDLPERA